VVTLAQVLAVGAWLLWGQTAFAQGARHFPAPDAPPQLLADPTSRMPDVRQAAEARAAFEEGVRLLRGERFSEAEAQFRRSIEIMPRASASYDLAFALYKQGRARESELILRGLLDEADGPLDPEYRAYANTLLARLMAEPPMAGSIVEPAAGAGVVAVAPTPPDAARPSGLEAGSRPGEGSAYPPVAPASGIPAGSGADVGPRGDSEHRGSAAWALWSATGVLAAGAATTGIIALVATGDLSRQLNTFPGDPEAIDQARRRAKTFSIASDAFVGGALLAGTLGLYVTLTSHRGAAARPSIHAGLGISGVELRGSY
jgi:hypothetical protein